MTSLTILGVTEILCSFRLVLEGKTGKEIPESSILELLEKNLEFKQFCFIRCRRQHLRAVAQSRHSRFTFAENTTGNSRKVLRAMFLGKDQLFCLLAYASLAASRTLLQQLLACLNFTLDSEDLFCWYTQKKLFLCTMPAAQAAENHGDE